jgi:hypothetical protein
LGFYDKGLQVTVYVYVDRIVFPGGDDGRGHRNMLYEILNLYHAPGAELEL